MAEASTLAAPVVRRTLVGHATLLPFITAAWLCSIAYEIRIGRALDPGAYGVFETLIGLLAVPSVVAAGAQLLVARAATGRTGPAGVWRTAFAAALAVTALVALLSPWLSAALRLPEATLLFAAALSGLWTVLGGARGAVQGSERYLALGASILAEGAGRLVGTLALIRIGAWGALLAVGIGAVVGFVPLRAALSPLPTGMTAAGERRAEGDLALYVAGSALVAALPTLPLIALRPVLGTTAYAALAAMALLGRGLAQIGGWLTQALYPRLVAAGELGSAAFAATVRLALPLAFLAAAAAAWLMPRLLTLAFAGRYGAYLALFRLFVFATLPVALLPLWLTEALARRSARGLLVLALALPLEAAPLLLVGARVRAALLAEAAVVIAIALYALVGRERRRPTAPTPATASEA